MCVCVFALSRGHLEWMGATRLEYRRALQFLWESDFWARPQNDYFYFGEAIPELAPQLNDFLNKQIIGEAIPQSEPTLNVFSYLMNYCVFSYLNERVKIGTQKVMSLTPSEWLTRVPSNKKPQ